MARNYHMLSILLCFCVATTTFAVPQSHSNVNSPESNGVSSEQITNGDDIRQNKTGTRVTGARGKRGASFSNSPSVESIDVSSQQIGQAGHVGTQGGYGGRVGQNGSNFPGSGRQNQTRGNGQQQFGARNGFGQRGKRQTNWSNSLSKSPSVESNGVSSEQVIGNGQGGIGRQNRTRSGSGGRGWNFGQNGSNFPGFGQGAGATRGRNGNGQNNGFGTGGFRSGFGGRGFENQGRQNQRQGNGQQLGTGRGLGQTGSNLESANGQTDQQNQQFGRQNGFGGRYKRSVNQGDIQELRNLTQANAQALRTLLSALDTAQEIEVLRIVTNHSLSRDQLEAATDQWAAQQNETVQQAYQQYKRTLEQLLAEMDEIHNEVAANLTAPARAVDQQLMAILSNSSLNHSQQCQRISRILANTTQEIKRELKRTFGPLPCQHNHHGRFGGRRGRWSNSDEFGGRGRGGATGGRGSPFGNNQGPFGQQPFQNRRNGFFDDSDESRSSVRNGQFGNNGQFGGRGGRGGNNPQPWSFGTQGGQFRQQGGGQFGRGQSPFGNNRGFGSPFGGDQQQRQGFGRF
ncbi:hypothetical protein DdX_05098 [Ditylenchus destructor]|uniref:SXP/RAL-2 family protein Ani s 5-like cation-binding domain-containing protein n=1 Tax=Ditylenchus destructor TaxID=166010 RepID=A0AAD4R446_9BILA|nr:hypothetical protein DdX_05098 [Ditylenchus destructor]